jgi:hypothetical protein
MTVKEIHILINSYLQEINSNVYGNVKKTTSISAYSEDNLHIDYLKDIHSIQENFANLYIVNRKPESGNMPLFLYYNVEPFNTGFNLYLHNPRYTNTGVTIGLFDLYMQNIYQGGIAGGDDEGSWTIGTRHSGNLNLFIETDPYIDHARSLNLVLNPGSGYLPPGYVSGDFSTDMDFFMEGTINPNTPPRVPGPTGDRNLNLFIKNHDAMANLDLFVYNNNISGNIPLYVSGTKTIGLGMPLLVDGKIDPSGSITLFQRGYEPYV